VALICPGLALAVEAPFAPTPSTVDYVATSSVKWPPGSPRSDRRIITHHAHWTRIEQEIDNLYRSVTYVKASVPLSISVGRRPSGEYSGLRILRGVDQDRTSGWDHAAFKTGEREIFLGESCEIWNVARHTARDGFKNAERTLNQLSCVTPDGIELWNRFTGDNYAGTSVETTHVERRPVDINDVRPPADLLSWAKWATPEKEAADSVAATDAQGDAVVTMEWAEPTTTRLQTKLRIVRRHFPWSTTENVENNGQRNLTIVNARSGLTLQLDQSPNGQFTRLTIHKPAPEAVRQNQKPVKMDQTEAILGEACTWFDMMPGMMDGSYAQCQTADGLVLKDRRSGRGTSQIGMVAVRLDRAPMALADVLPPPSVLVPGYWGISD
jgi:hypothetical protein